MRRLTPFEKLAVPTEESQTPIKPFVPLESVLPDTDTRRATAQRDLKMMRDSVPILFKRALEVGDPYMAFVQLGNVYKYKLDNYPGVLNQFLKFLDALLEKADSGGLVVYRNFLSSLRDKASSGDFPESTGAPPASKTVRPPVEDATNPGVYRDIRLVQVNQELSEAELVVSVQAFKNAIADKDFFWAFWHLAKLNTANIPQFKGMVREFVSMVDAELNRDDATVRLDYKNRLARLQLRAQYNKFD